MKHFFWLVMLIIIAFVVYIFLGPLKFFIDVSYHPRTPRSNLELLNAAKSIDNRFLLIYDNSTNKLN